MRPMRTKPGIAGVLGVRPAESSSAASSLSLPSREALGPLDAAGGAKVAGDALLLSLRADEPVCGLPRPPRRELPRELLAFSSCTCTIANSKEIHSVSSPASVSFQIA